MQRGGFVKRQKGGFVPNFGFWNNIGDVAIGGLKGFAGGVSTMVTDFADVPALWGGRSYGTEWRVKHGLESIWEPGFMADDPETGFVGGIGRKDVSSYEKAGHYAGAILGEAVTWFGPQALTKVAKISKIPKLGKILKAGGRGGLSNTVESVMKKLGDFEKWSGLRKAGKWFDKSKLMKFQKWFGMGMGVGLPISGLLQMLLGGGGGNDGQGDGSKMNTQMLNDISSDANFANLGPMTELLSKGGAGMDSSWMADQNYYNQGGNPWRSTGSNSMGATIMQGLSGGHSGPALRTDDHLGSAGHLLSTEGPHPMSSKPHHVWWRTAGEDRKQRG